MLCPNCETQNDDDARLCIECGFPLSGAVSRGAGSISPAKDSSQQHATRRTPRSTRTSSHPSSVANPPINGAFQQDFSWESPAGDNNPAKALFDSSSFQPVSQDATQAVPARQNSPIQQPQIVQVDLQGRALTPDVTQQMHPVEDSLPDFFEESYEYDDYNSHNDRTETILFDESYDSERLSSDETIIEQAQEEFDAFYQEQPTSRATTIKFADADRTTIQKPHRRPAARNKTGNRKESTSANQRNYRIPQKQQGLTGKQRGLIIGGAVVILAALIFVVGFALGIWGGVPVPNVVDMSEAEAVKVLEENGFKPRVEYAKSDETEGRVLSTDPKPGSFAEEGSEIVVQVSIARTIPDVVGMELEEALQTLEESGYTNIKTTIERTDGRENVIISTTPTADTRAKSTMEITIVVSENYKVPDIAGMTYEEASKTITDAGLTPSVAYVDTDEYPDGTIVGTDPAAGTRVSEGATVSINIARKRGVELKALATELLSAGNTVSVDGVNYQVESLTSLEYKGDDIVAFTIQALPYVEFFGETLFASSSQTVTGSIQYDSNNEVVSIN